MRVLILGGHGRMGPAVVEALGPHHELLVTDVVTPITDEHETRQLDASSLDEVVAAADATSANRETNFGPGTRSPALFYDLDCPHG